MKCSPTASSFRLVSDRTSRNLNMLGRSFEKSALYPSGSSISTTRYQHLQFISLPNDKRDLEVDSLNLQQHGRSKITQTKPRRRRRRRRSSTMASAPGPTNSSQHTSNANKGTQYAEHHECTGRDRVDGSSVNGRINSNPRCNDSPGQEVRAAF